MSPNSHHKHYLALLILRKQGHPSFLGRGSIGKVTLRIYQRLFNLRNKKGKYCFFPFVHVCGQQIHPPAFKYWGEVFGAHKHGLLSAEDTWPPDGQRPLTSAHNSYLCMPVTFATRL